MKKLLLTFAVSNCFSIMAPTSFAQAKEAQSYYLTSCMPAPRAYDNDGWQVPQINMRATDEREKTQSAMLYAADRIYGTPLAPADLGVAVYRSRTVDNHLEFDVEARHQIIATIYLQKDSKGTLSGQFVANPAFVSSEGLGSFEVKGCRISVDGTGNLAGDY